MSDYFQYDDNQLIALMREKHPICNEAFNVVYYRYSERLKSYCHFKSDSKEDAAELFQETWLKFHGAVISGKNNILLPAYLYTIARNLSIDKFRLKKNHLIYYNEELDYGQFADSLNLQNNIENKELMSLITLALNQLGEIYKETFILKWFSGLSYPEISQILGETADCIKKRASRAFDELLKILKPVIAEINK
jgi:RNA polymerase sigma-70 factor, ECF subfamily